MVIVVSVLVLAVLVAVLAAAVGFVRPVTRWAMRPSPSSVARVAPHEPTPPAYGALPTPADPVGPLGGLAPDAGLGDPAASSRELHGE